jgi:hypothetical protein
VTSTSATHATHGALDARSGAYHGRTNGGWQGCHSEQTYRYPCRICGAPPKTCPGCLANPGELGPLDPDNPDPWF